MPYRSKAVTNLVHQLLPQLQNSSLYSSSSSGAKCELNVQAQLKVTESSESNWGKLWSFKFFFTYTQSAPRFADLQWDWRRRIPLTNCSNHIEVTTLKQPSVKAPNRIKAADVFRRKVTEKQNDTTGERQKANSNCNEDKNTVLSENRYTSWET